MEGSGCPETHRKPQAVPIPPPQVSAGSSTTPQRAERCRSREGSNVPHPRDGDSPALTWRRGQPGAGSGTWRNPSLRRARSSLAGKKASALGWEASLQLLSTPGPRFPPTPPALSSSTAVSQRPGTAAFTQGLCLPFGRGQASGSHPGRVCLPARLLRKVARGALSQCWSKGETQAWSCTLTLALQGGQ